MRHFDSLDAAHLENTYLTIGVFDGVHVGHQALVRQLVSRARASHGTAVVLTFFPHPAAVLSGKEAFLYLTIPEERADLLARLGVDVVIMQTFDLALASHTAEEFMARLKKSLGLRYLLIGYDFALGHGREGHAARLAELGEQLGYQLEVLAPVRCGEEAVSSSAIRARLEAGQVESAALLLGRPYTLTGLVVHGEGRGRALRIPTANLDLPPTKLIPANGVYACWTWVGEERYASVTNIGIRPTFDACQAKPLVESHLLDFSGDLYGRTITVEFIARLRDEVKFPSVEALLFQIQEDVRSARHRFAEVLKSDSAG